MSVTYSGSSNPSLAAAMSAAVDMDAALSQHDNLALMWHLLYDPKWQVGRIVVCSVWVFFCTCVG